jgi:hypothetical protein
MVFYTTEKNKSKEESSRYRRFEKKGTGYFFLNEKDCFYAWTVHTGQKK